jgi:hypothetical protein
MDDPLWIDLSLKTVLLKTSLVGKVNIPFEPAAFEALYNFLLV